MFFYNFNWLDRNKNVKFTIDKIHFQESREEDFVIKRIFEKNRFYEADLLLFLQLTVPCGGVFIDVGANIGNHTVYFAKYLADEVVSIEPNMEVSRLLKRNIEMNAPDICSIVNAGIGLREGTGMVVLDDNTNTGTARVEYCIPTLSPDGSQHSGEQIKIMTLDSVMKNVITNNKKVALIKIDVEGMQLDVLRSARETLMKYRPCLVVEAETDAERSEVFDYLNDLGYKPVKQLCATPTYVFMSDLNGKKHYFTALPFTLAYKTYCFFQKVINLFR